MQVALVVNLPASTGDFRDMDSTPGSVRSGEGHGNPTPCRENPMDGGTWWATVHRVTQSWTQLKQLGTRTLQMQSLETEKSKRLSLPTPSYVSIPPSTFRAKMHSHFRNEGCSDAGQCQCMLTAINGNVYPSLYPKGAQLVTLNISDTGEKNKGKSQEKCFPTWAPAPLLNQETVIRFYV